MVRGHAEGMRKGWYFRCFGGLGGESIANTDVLEEISSETVQNTAFCEARVEKASQIQMFFEEIRNWAEHDLFHCKLRSQA